MTTLTITPDVAKKRMKIDGVIAAGEKVAVTVKGFGDKSVIDTRLRVYCGRELIAIYPKDPEEGQQQIPWSVNGNDLTCELDLFTLQAEKATRCGCAECLFILDDYMAGQLYATREKEILKWIKRGGSDIPYDLSGYPDFVSQVREEIDAFKGEINSEMAAYKIEIGDAWAEYRQSMQAYYNQFTVTVTGMVADKASAADLHAHIDDKTNPHEVTKAQVGLGNVDNTSDAQKPVSLAQQLAINAERDRALAAEATKADLVGGKVPASQLPSYVDDVLEFPTRAQFPATGESGKIYIDVSRNEQYRWSGTQYVKLGGGAAGEDVNAVHYYEETKTEAEKSQARKNLGIDFVGKLPMKPLPKYLHYLQFDDTYDADAQWFYSQLGPSDLGRCSSVRRDGKLYRTYDWTFDDAAEFVVKVSGNATRFASVGMASVGSRLTENDVMSGVNSRYYKCLPGMTLDGINENGVVAEINVDGGPESGWNGQVSTSGIHILAAVRWVLDHGETAQQAAEWIANHIIRPTGEMNFHFMVADATKTYIVENGYAWDVTDGTKVLTNYALLDMAHAGGGKERYQLLAGGADISAVNFTNAYQEGNDWDSDFDSAEQHAEAIEQWAEQGETKEAHRGKTSASGKAWWQSVHTPEYDFAEKTMKVAVQETDDWYVFGLSRDWVPKIAMGFNEIWADGTMKIHEGLTPWTPGEVVEEFQYKLSNIEYRDGVWKGYLWGWNPERGGWEIDTDFAMEGDSGNPDAKELTFPITGTITRRTPIIRETNVAMVDDLRYDLYAVPTTGEDAYKLRARATNYLVYDSSAESYTFDLSANRPPDVQGKMTDYFIELHTDAPVTVTTSAADTAKIRGDSPSVGAAGDYWITVTTKADGNIYIRNLKMEAPQA